MAGVDAEGVSLSWWLIVSKKISDDLVVFCHSFIITQPGSHENPICMVSVLLKAVLVAAQIFLDIFLVLETVFISLHPFTSLDL